MSDGSGCWSSSTRDPSSSSPASARTADAFLPSAQLPVVSPATSSDRGKRKAAKKVQSNRPSKAAVCDNCRRRKIQCDLQTPCKSCILYSHECLYSAVDPAMRIERLLAIEAPDVERTIALRDLREEQSQLLAQVDKLKERLMLSENELSELYETANEQMLQDKTEFDKMRLRHKPALVAAVPPAARGTALRTDVVSRGPEAVAPPPPLRAPELQWPHKRERERSGDNLASEMPPPSAAVVRDAAARNGRRPSLMRAANEVAPSPPRPSSISAPTVPTRMRQEGPPPLPPIDPTGRPYPAAAYHFPRTFPMPPQVPMLAPPAWMAPMRLPAVPVYPVHGLWHAPTEPCEPPAVVEERQRWYAVRPWV